jgi:hypothetical protein
LAAVPSLCLVAASLGAQLAMGPRSFTAGKTLVRITSPVVSEAWVSSVVATPTTVSRMGTRTPVGAPIKSGVGDVAERSDIAVSASPIELVSLAQTGWAGQRIGGEIINVNDNFKAQSEVDFVDAVVTALEIPALDAASTAVANGKLWLRPESERWRKSDDRSLAAPNKSLEKKWLPSNFRLTIGGLDEACRHVNKIEALTIKRKTVEMRAGTQGASGSQSSIWEPSALAFTLPTADARGFYDWLKAARSGKGGERKTAVVQLLSANQQTVLATLRGTDAIIVAVNGDALSAGGENGRRVKVELLVENWQIGSGSGAGVP